MKFKTYLAKNSERMNNLVAQYFKGRPGLDIDLYLYAPLSAYSANGGKRHRPLICEIACQAVGGDARLAASAASAIEHFHTAALIHDDIADESELRRGEPALHKAIGEGLAINAGDLALSQVTGVVLADKVLNDATKLSVLDELVQMTSRTIEGQALDLGWARDGRFDLTVDDYLNMAILKTAHYSGGTPLAVGAIVAGGTEEQIETLRQFGIATGLAFQIQDDLLNLTSSKEATKKDFRSDITEGKRTLMVVHALQNGGALRGTGAGGSALRGENAGGSALRGENAGAVALTEDTVETPTFTGAAALTEDTVETPTFTGAAALTESQALIDILGAHSSDPKRLQAAVDILQATGSLDFAHRYALNLVQTAKPMLAQVLPKSKYRDLLSSMADFFVERMS